MTKKTIETVLDNSDWLHSMDGMTVQEALCYLENFPVGAKLNIDYGYDYGDSESGEITVTREETDEEYKARLAQEAKEGHQRWEAQRKAEEQLTERMMLIAAKDVAFKEYMEKHKDNPNIGDLSNLFMAVMSLTKAGAGGSAVGPLLEIMARLEQQ